MTLITGIVAQAFIYAGPAMKSALDNAKDVADIISSAVTALAVIIGGVWAYFKFARGRTYRPSRAAAIGGLTWRDAGIRVT
jgi:hypothetical protein